MSDSPFFVGLLIIVAILPVGDAIATAFFWSLFRRSKREEVLPIGERQRPFWRSSLLGGRSWLLALLTISFAIITDVFILLGLLAVRRLFGAPPFEQGALLSVIGLVFLGLIPIAFAIAFYRQRRRRDGKPPPFGEFD